MRTLGGGMRIVYMQATNVLEEHVYRHGVYAKYSILPEPLRKGVVNPGG
jgi:hypothetical protein